MLPETKRPTDHRPWNAGRPADDDGAWSEFGAWRSWMEAQLERHTPDIGDLLIVSDLESGAQVALYVICCELADQGHKP